MRWRSCLIVLVTCFAATSAAYAADAGTGPDHPGSGFIHATVTWPSGESKTGYLRWEDEEAFWDDLFHCGYRERQWGRYVDRDAMRRLRREEYYRTHGLLDRIAYALAEDKDDPLGWRGFVSRFGDLRSIEIHDGEDDFAITADGGRHQIGGYANDAGSRLLLYTAGSAEPERIRWNDLTEILFTAAPSDHAPYAERLYGRLDTTVGTWEGYIQWDKSECTGIDVLDADEMDIPMGEILSLARTRDNNTEAVLRDGTTQSLHGSNDVGSGNRGIMVEVAGLGRITVPWNRFEKLTFVDGHGSGPGRGSYDNAAPLTGTVTTDDGTAHTGRLVLDLDEAFDWDLLNGTDADGLDYDIPLRLVSRIEPREDLTCRVTLLSGTTIELGESNDTGDGNEGVLVLENPGDEDAEHLPWATIRRIDLEH